MACMKRLGQVLASALLVVAVLASNAGTPRAQDAETAATVFHDHISGPIVQTKCVNCHVEGGRSGHTRLVFVRRSSEVDHKALNLQTFEDFLAAVDEAGGGGNYILNKVRGVSHGGGEQVPLGSAHFANMEWFLGLLGEQIARVRLTPETLFDTVVLASDRKTLRRAALIFAGRIPTVEEYAAVGGGDELVLRATVRGLMEGPQFHEFLLQASNDRLLTDRQDPELLSPVEGFLVGYTNESYRRAVAAGSRNTPEFWEWQAAVQYGARRAPLELIAHVVENDLPYTEILTADYIMANPMTATAYGASTRFDDPEDVYEFRPARIVDYYRRGEGYESEYDPLTLAVRVLDPGPLHTDYPHAGILNTIAFLKRYPSTATNRNRARSRWTYYHFLGLDIEKSASRTTDPVALADTNNPTMHNPACTVCHSVLDPVAGAFQNYGDEGWYRDKWGGQDSLDDLYKEGKVAALAVQADAWENRDTLVWPLTLFAGTETLRVMFTNPFPDEGTGESGTVWLDRLTVVDAQGSVLVSHEFEDLEVPVAHWGACGQVEYNDATRRQDHVLLWWG